MDAIVVDPTNTTSEELFLAPLLKDDDDTVPGAVDFKRRPAIRSKHGGWKSASFIIGVEMAERIAYFGVCGNLINFLTEKLGQSTAMAAINVNTWSGVAMLLPLLGGAIADSFLGKYNTIIASSLLYILGLGLLTVSAMLPSLSGEMSTQGKSKFSDSLPVIIFFIALYLVAIGQSGHKPCTQAFGADQFDGEDPREIKAKSSFFNWWYFGVCFSSVLGVAILSYVQDNLSWGLGFGIPCIIMFIALVLLLLGTTTYRYYMKEEGHSPIKRMGKVFIEAAKNWRVMPSVTLDNEAAQGTQLPHNACQQFRFLDKALHSYSSTEKKQACKQDIEDAKSMLGLFPIWATILVFAIVLAQLGTMFTKQGVTLDRSVANFVIPAATLQCLTSISTMVVLSVYDRVLVPVTRALTGKPAGITVLKRIGLGLFISIIEMVVAALIEKRRLQIALEHGLINSPNVTIPMSIVWLFPQYVLFGTAEAFTLVGLQEFFYGQVPNELRSVGMALYLSIFGIGGLLSSLFVSILDKATSRSGADSWFSDNLNKAHLDYFYWLLAGLSAVGLALFMFCARSFVYAANKARQ